MGVLGRLFALAEKKVNYLPKNIHYSFINKETTLMKPVFTMTGLLLAVSLMTVGCGPAEQAAEDTKKAAEKAAQTAIENTHKAVEKTTQTTFEDAKKAAEQAANATLEEARKAAEDAKQVAEKAAQISIEEAKKSTQTAVDDARKSLGNAILGVDSGKQADGTPPSKTEKEGNN
ncbi:MAG TPA: hypothetical protein PLE99_07710 [Candidatus Thiothrix moscowensis]|uniref:hypothetical protein n=2 Tax=Thiothrix TaxID=1030 RepID=UPI0025FFAE85|nr:MULTISPECIES: hypothetical protein [unclassified Thiothrix]HRJ52637.1 hypothetical protein [Candidatus Thiothrix moscowensis]HRJ92879.1 hypothetical protein [Candidatus Thiothrix moscowensis]